MNHQTLARQLHDEGISSSPEFSTELHERTMRLLCKSQARHSATVFLFKQWCIGIAAAAAILIATTAWYFHQGSTQTLPNPPRQGISVTIYTVAASDIYEPIELLTQPLVGQNPMSDFATDITSMAHYFVRQIPSLPSGKTKVQEDPT